MFDANNLLANIDSNGLAGKLLGGLANKNFSSGLLTGGVAGLLLGGGKNPAKSLVKAGGLALLGALAYQAYGNYQRQKAAGGNTSAVDSVKAAAADMADQAGRVISGVFADGQPRPNDSTASIAGPASTGLSLAIIRAMIAAAKSDGHMDAIESQKILGRLETAGLGAEEKALLMQEMANPQDINTIAAAANTPEESTQIYLSALMVCDSQCAAEQKYLASLASALKLDPAFTASLQQELLALSQQKEV